MASPYSVASSTGSPHGTISVDDSDSFDFDPDRDEALCSTYPIKRNRARSNVPDLRDTAKKYGRWSPQRPHQDIIVNTSALANAFPDFSQVVSSDDTFSTELPRGRKSKQNITSQPTPQSIHQNLSSALDFSGSKNSPVIDIGKGLRVMTTPRPGPQIEAAILNITKAQNSQPTSRANTSQRSTKNASHKFPNPQTAPIQPKNQPTGPTIFEDASRKSSNLFTNNGNTSNTLPSHFATEQKENIPPVSQPKSSKRSPYTSNASRTISGERRTLKELHARVADDESDGSFLAERPATVTLQQKNTRFPPKAVQQSAADHIFTPVPNEKPNNATNRSFFLNAAKSNPNTQTIQSNALPAVQNGKIIKNDGKRTSFGPVNDMDCPQEEKDIYKLADDLKAEVAQLKLALQQQRAQLSEENKSLRQELDVANQKTDQLQTQNQLSQQGTSRISEENKSLRQELEVAYKTVDHLQNQNEMVIRQNQQKSHLVQENQNLQLENEALGRQINQLLSEQENSSKEKAALRSQLNNLLAEKEETTRTFEQKETALRNKLQRSDRAVQQLTRNMSRQLREHTEVIEIAETNITKMSSGGKTKQKSNKNRIQDDQQQLTAQARQQAFGANGQKAQHIIAPLEQHDDSHITQEESFEGHSEASTHFTDVCGPEFSHQYREFMKKSKAFVASQKARLENEEQASVYDDTHDDTAQTIQSGRSSQAPSLKGDDLKNVNPPNQEDLTGRFSVKSAQFHDDTVQTIQSGRSSRAPSIKGGILKNNNPRNHEDHTDCLSVKSATSNGHTQDQTRRSNTHRRHRSQVEEDHTVRSTTSHRRHYSETNFHTRRQTDADDMTSAYLAADIEAAKQSSGNERPVLSPSARRVLDGLCEHNRTNCTICLRVASFETTSPSKKTIRVQKPIPVSKRAPSPVPYEDEPTLRPAVAPGIALATVMKGMDDEHAHLKMKLAEITEAYMKHDVTLGKRRRERLEQEMEKLQKQLKDKSNQIYALNDVLEGQVQSGQEMTQEEIDVTWMSGDSEELPWEGIEESV